jgi:hypothetical protein
LKNIWLEKIILALTPGRANWTHQRVNPVAHGTGIQQRFEVDEIMEMSSPAKILKFAAKRHC